jgi:uncharacterized RDD family membrane protein YckC
VKVGDFGLSISTLARVVHHDLEAGGFQGTPQFAPPEQLRGEPLDIRADIYAVGATLYYLLTGQPPFDARDLRELVSRVTSEAPRSPRALRRGIPAGLAAVVLQCLAKIPGERPRSYADLAEALRPFLPSTALPANPGLRFLAGFADSIILSVPVATVFFLVTRLGSTMGIVWALLPGSLYAFVLESLWGATLGEMLLGLRVRSADGSRAPWWRILIRTAIGTAIGALQILFWVIPQAAGYEGWVQTHTTLISLLSTVFTLGITGAMFLTARRENGYASLYDMISGTRVVIRPAERGRRVGTASAQSPAENLGDPSDEHIGPFTVIGAVGNARAGRLLAAFDPVLRRRVWIQMVPPGTPPIAPGRRDISRVTRLHWLTGRRSGTNTLDNWDAFEAPSGAPLLKRNEASLDWPAARVVLADLLHELADSLREGSLPPLGLDRLWTRADGRTVLLDFEAPSGEGVVASPSSAKATPMELLGAVAGRVTMPETVSKASAPRLPLSARRLLRRWSREAPHSLEEAQAQLRQATASHERVSRWRRAVPIAMAAGPILFVALSTLIVYPNADVVILTPEDREVIGLLKELETDISSPEYRLAVETYLAGEHGALLRNTPLWSSSAQGPDGDRPELRRLASDIATRHPSVTAEEVARSKETIRSTLDRVRPPQRLNVARPGVIALSVMGAVGSLMALFFSIVSSIAVPGGVVTRLIGLAVVTRDGNEIGRVRSLARTLIAWAPILAWLVLLFNPIFMGFGPASPLPVLAVSVAFGTMIVGVVWTIAATDRGLHDRISRTWVVPR